ncbi:Uncharacterised protein [Escherichia coli]|nr:Uncharacterised protein [Escherichia coli]
MKNTGYILALCLTASGHVLAHDVWITGKQAENNITAEIGYGHNFPSKGTIPDRRNFFENPRIYNGKETITLKPASTDYVYKTESASKDNGYVLSTYMNRDTGREPLQDGNRSAGRAEMMWLTVSLSLNCEIFYSWCTADASTTLSVSNGA